MHKLKNTKIETIIVGIPIIESFHSILRTDYNFSKVINVTLFRHW